MDDHAFDRLTKVLSASPTRRHAIALAAGLITGLAGSDEDSVLGKGKGKGKKGRKKGKGKGRKKKRQDEPKGEFCGDRYCEPNQRCCGGGCNDPDRCCTRNSECNPCELCSPMGICEPNPARNGTACRGCLECINGACGIPNDDFCPEDHQCRGETGGCCPTCLQNDQCCPANSACINPGLLNDNFCCDTFANTPCGDNGDGTFQACCSNFNETCVGGECVPRGECPDGWKSCPGRTGSHCAPEEFSCCGDLECNTFHECCDASKDLCCLKGRCTAGRCCPEGREVCGDTCCDFGKVCCGSECCSPSSCVDGKCCPNGVCGRVGDVSRICPADDEFCCPVDPRNPNHGGYACPKGDEDAGAADCAPGGRCCPAGTFYNDDCDLCCVDIVRLCPNQPCVPPTPGRF